MSEVGELAMVDCPRVAMNDHESARIASLEGSLGYQLLRQGEVVVGGEEPGRHRVKIAGRCTPTVPLRGHRDAPPYHP